MLLFLLFLFIYAKRYKRYNKKVIKFLLQEIITLNYLIIIKNKNFKLNFHYHQDLKGGGSNVNLGQSEAKSNEFES